MEQNQKIYCEWKVHDAKEFIAPMRCMKCLSRDIRGEAVEELIDRRNMGNMNEEGEVFTYDSIHGEDNIDLTLLRGGTREKFENGMVQYSIKENRIYIWNIPDKIARGKFKKNIKIGTILIDVVYARGIQDTYTKIIDTLLLNKGEENEN
ncbi:hypothetical protein PR048_030043 [Dryococelus australis]|uniref:Uncharacterized protein n=1 Tax=Dryococelus australis TaxID=614101 RepID=A0ABQ9G7V4_9NEOP|nr:hypothetical protein PR048_030043 [Dryococelus australis]